MNAMIYSATHAFLDADVLHLDGIDLTPWQIQQAALTSQNLETQNRCGVDQAWQTYLNRLALFGLQNWLEERATDLKPALRSAVPFAPEQLATIQAGTFQVGAIALGSLPDTVVEIPQHWVQAQSHCHFYVLVEVLEEQEQVKLYGYLRRDQLQQRTATADLLSNAEGMVSLPLEWFTPEMDQLLLHLRCLAAEALPLVAPAAQPQEAPQPTAQTRPWTQPAIAPGLQAGQVVKAVAQPLLNTANWLFDELDAIAQEWGWMLLPQPQLRLKTALRSVQSPVGQFEQVIGQLRRAGMEIPLKARGVCREFCWGKTELRLYVLTWNLAEMTGAPEWSFLVILGAQPDALLPAGIRLRIQDARQVLVERTLSEQDLGAHLYGQVIGDWGESFQVSIHLNAETSLTLPPFGFNP